MYRLILNYDITITRMNNLQLKKKKKMHDIRIVYFAQKYDLTLYIYIYKLYTYKINLHAKICIC